MDVVLRVGALGLAALFLVVGTLKLVRPLPVLHGMGMTWVHDWGPTKVRLVLPSATGIAPWPARAAAAGLVVVMAGAVVVRGRRHESVAAPLVLLLLGAGVAVLG